MRIGFGPGAGGSVGGAGRMFLACFSVSSRVLDGPWTLESIRMSIILWQM